MKAGIGYPTNPSDGLSIITDAGSTTISMGGYGCRTMYGLHPGSNGARMTIA